MEDIRTGLKIRARTLHENAVTRNVLIRTVLTLLPLASACTTMQQNEPNPALDPALDFVGTERTLPDQGGLIEPSRVMCVI